MTTPGSSDTPTRRERREQQDGAGSPRRTVIIVIVVLAAIAAAVAGWYFFVRDDDSTASSSSSTSSSVSSSTSSTASTNDSTSTTTSAGTSDTLTPPPNADVQSFAEALFAAWSNNDRTAAAKVANRASIDTLFAEPSSDATSWTFSGCRHVGSYYCTWTRAGGQIAMTASDTASGVPMQIIDVTIGAG